MKREPTAADRIYEAFRQRILTCEYGEDMAFNEVQLANEFGVRSEEHTSELQSRE